MDSNLGIIEIQGTAEVGSFSRVQTNQMLDLAEKGIKELFIAQQQALQNGHWYKSKFSTLSFCCKIVSNCPSTRYLWDNRKLQD